MSAAWIPAVCLHLRVSLPVISFLSVIAKISQHLTIFRPTYQPSLLAGYLPELPGSIFGSKQGTNGCCWTACSRCRGTLWWRPRLLPAPPAPGLHRGQPETF
jgi:hypothetical protein